MDEYVAKLVKFLSSTVLVRFSSSPNFSVEIFLALAVCVVHSLLLFEVNTLVKRTNAKAAVHLRVKHRPKDFETCSYHSMVTVQTHLFHKKPPEFYQKSSVYAPISARVQKRLSRSNMDWVMARGDSVLRHTFSDRIQYLLAISPSEYVRRDKEKKSREQGLRSCIQSLTSLLEKALNNDPLDIANISKEDIRKSLNTLRENFETRLTSDGADLGNFPSASLQNLIEESSAKRLLKSSLSPDLVSSIYRASNVSFSRSSYDTRATVERPKTAEEKRSNAAAASKETLSVKSSQSLSELFRKQSDEFLELTTKQWQTHRDGGVLAK